MEFRIEPYLLKLTIVQPGDKSDEIREVDVAQAQDGLDSLFASLQDVGQLIPRLVQFLEGFLQVEDITETMALQIQGAILKGYEEFKKKAPQELVSHLDITSTRTSSIPLPPGPSLSTSPDLEPSESSNSDK